VIHIPIEVPKPSKFVPHSMVDEIANDVIRLFEPIDNKIQRYLLDVETVITSQLDIELSWEKIAEPESRVCFARSEEANNSFKIVVNENHRELFDHKKSLFRSCLSHEIGHCILRHFESFNSNDNQTSLFDIQRPRPHYFHDSAWGNIDLTREELMKVKSELAKTASINDDDRELIRLLEDKLEPEWMFWQAEQFASCFLVPKDRLMDLLERGIDITRWRELYSIAAQFGVSISMITVRLKKLGLIEINGKEITLVPLMSGSTLL
jgi:IrrE N-terminal-like domain